jgi:hypothetical protein
VNDETYSHQPLLQLFKLLLVEHSQSPSHNIPLTNLVPAKKGFVPSYLFIGGVKRQECKRPTGNGTCCDGERWGGGMCVRRGVHEKVAVIASR